MVGLAAICLLYVAVRTADAGQTERTGAAPAASSDHNGNARSSPEYAGDEACRTCHSSIYATFKQTGMGRSTSIPSAEDLRELSKPVAIVGKR